MGRFCHPWAIRIGNYFSPSSLSIGVLAAVFLLPTAGSAGDAGKAPPNANKAFAIIDLGFGTNATSYALEFRDQLPEDFPSETYKTSKIVLKRIEPATFTMGQTKVALPSHSVTLSKPYYIGVFEITQAQWTKVMGATEFHFDEKTTKPADSVSWEDIRGGGRAHDWPEARTIAKDSFMGRLNSRTAGSGRFDLPTEAQWENACRAGTKTSWHFGDDAEAAEEHAWFRNNSIRETHEVGKLNPNAWGLHDMHGNVAEWCLDRHGDYPRAKRTDPVGPTSGWFWIWRGGS